MSQQNTVLIDDIMSALDAESSQNVELIVRNTQNGATKKMALASLEQIIYSYLTTAPVVSNLASVLGVCSTFGAIGSLAYADDISNTCMAYIWSSTTGLNPVFTYYFQKERAFQFAIIDRATIKFRYKWNSTWNAWYDLT